MIFESIYNKGYEAGMNAQKVSDHEDQNRRLEDMFRRGKEYGLNEGFTKGYEKGYHDGNTIGYNDGVNDTRAKEGIINIPDEVLAEVKEEFEAVEDDMEAV